jgi:hypothetical protein
MLCLTYLDPHLPKTNCPGVYSIWGSHPLTNLLPSFYYPSTAPPFTWMENLTDHKGILVPG